MFTGLQALVQIFPSSLARIRWAFSRDSFTCFAQGGIRLFLQELSRNEFSNDNESIGGVDIQNLPATQEVMVWYRKNGVNGRLDTINSESVPADADADADAVAVADADPTRSG